MNLKQKYAAIKKELYKSQIVAYVYKINDNEMFDKFICSDIDIYFILKSANQTYKFYKFDNIHADSITAKHLIINKLESENFIEINSWKNSLKPKIKTKQNTTAKRTI